MRQPPPAAAPAEHPAQHSAALLARPLPCRCQVEHGMLARARLALTRVSCRAVLPRGVNGLAGMKGDAKMGLKAGDVVIAVSPEVRA